MYGTYCRLHVPVWATTREVIRAAQTKLMPRARYSRQDRTARHAFYRTMLDYHAKARRLYDHARTG